MTILNVTIYHLNFLKQEIYIYTINILKSILKEYFLSYIFNYQQILPDYSTFKVFPLLTTELLLTMFFLKHLINI